MRRLLLITVQDLRLFVRRPGTWISLVVLPILFTLVLGVAFASDDAPQRLRVDVIDGDRSPESALLLAELQQADENLLLCPSPMGAEEDCDLPATLTPDEGVQRVRDGERDALLVIPAGFADALRAYTPVQIDYYSASDPGTPDPVQQTLAAVLPRIQSTALNRAVAMMVLDRLNAAATGPVVDDAWIAQFDAALQAKTASLLAERPPLVDYVAVGGEAAAPAGGFGQSVPGVGSMYVMFTVLGGIAALQRERQSWTLPRLAAMPLTRSQILGGKILTYFVLGMLQYLIVFAVGWVVGLDFGPQPWLIVPIMVAFVFCCTALALAIAPLMRNPGQATAMTQMLSLAFAALGGAWWPLTIVPGWMQRVGHLSPVAWAMDAFQDLLFYQGNLNAILPEIGVLLSAGLICFGFGVWRFRYL
jgi:ABC-2 type transport system permease protein